MCRIQKRPVRPTKHASATSRSISCAPASTPAAMFFPRTQLREHESSSRHARNSAEHRYRNPAHVLSARAPSRRWPRPGSPARTGGSQPQAPSRPAARAPPARLRPHHPPRPRLQAAALAPAPPLQTSARRRCLPPPATPRKAPLLAAAPCARPACGGALPLGAAPPLSSPRPHHRRQQYLGLLGWPPLSCGGPASLAGPPTLASAAGCPRRPLPPPPPSRCS